MKTLFSVAVLIGLISGSAFAADSAAWELRGGSNAFFAIETNNDPYTDTNTTNTEINLFGVYGYFLTPAWEPQVSLSTNITTGSNALTIVTPMAGIAYNFGNETANAFYLGGRIGPQFRRYSTGTGHGYTVFAYNVFLGKRFRLADKISWAPEVSFSGHTSGSSDDSNGRTYQLGFYKQWTFTPFQIALVF